MNCLRISELESLAASLVKGATMELHLTPKPGLVDLADSGSHPDLTVPIMEQSICHVSDYLDEIVRSLAKDEPFECQKNLGIKAEQRLHEKLGTNTHKGFIFLGGMLLIAHCKAASLDEDAIRMTLSSLADAFFKSSEDKSTNGQQARKKYNAGGIVHEAIKGFPSLFEQALPAYRTAVKQHRESSDASFAMLSRLMQTVDDTTTLHRAGSMGLSRLKRDGRMLEHYIANGDDYLAYLRELNDTYRRLNLTMGGVADMLGLAFGYLIASGEITENKSFSPIEKILL